MQQISPDEMMLEPTDVDVRLLGLPKTTTTGHKIHLFLEQMAWQRNGGGGQWIPTDAGNRFASKHAWINHGKRGYHCKWKVEAVRNELQRRGMLPAQGA